MASGRLSLEALPICPTIVALAMDGPVALVTRSDPDRLLWVRLLPVTERVNEEVFKRLIVFSI